MQCGRCLEVVTPLQGKGVELANEAIEDRRQSTERATYLHQADALQAEADLLAAEREPGDVQFDEESGEGDTLAVERERDLALSAQARAAIEEIDHALAKFEIGSYGLSEESGEPIPYARLEAIPWARYTVAEEEELEKG